MAAEYKYRPDYKKLYPGITITDEVMAVLKESDRKMEYLEYDIKAERFYIDPQTCIHEFLPSREDSLDRLVELDVQFRADGCVVEDEAVRVVLIEQMMRCLDLLTEPEQELIRALYFEEKSEREYSKKAGIPQRTINDRRYRILHKLKKMMDK